MSEGIQSVQRALYVLERLASCKEGATASEIAKELGVNRSTVFRLMETLIEEGYVRQATLTKRYHLTMRVFSLGSKLLTEMNIQSSARGVLEALQKETGHTVHLGLRDLFEVVYIDKISGNSPIQMYSMIGKRAPLYCTAIGKAILAFMRDDEIETFFNTTKFDSFTPFTLTDPAAIIRDLELTRTRGYTLDLEEHEMGIRCVAAPIFNFNQEVIGSISVAAVAINLGNRDIEEHADATVQAAKTISSLMGAHF